MDEVFADKFATESDLDNWIISFYIGRLRYYNENFGNTTKNGVKITNRLIFNTRRRYMELLIRKQCATNGELRRKNK